MYMQVATLLCYGKPQVLHVFKNTLPTRLYWVLFPIEDLRQAVETVMRILTIDKIDRQLVGQSSSMSFMNIKDGNTSKKATFNTQDNLEEKIDRLMTLMCKGTAQDDSENRWLSLKYIRVREEVRQEIFMIDMTEIIKIGIDQIVEIGEFHLVVEYNMGKTIETEQGMTRTTGMTLGE